MLYIFHVDTGTLMTFDMSLTMESVQNLKLYVQQVSGIPADKQVLLVSGGECLDPTKRVCSYSAGTDTNPIFLFSKSIIESTVPPSPSVGSTLEYDLRDKVRECADLPASYNAVAKRAQLAQEFFDLAKEQLQICEKLVHDQHMQQQGWAAVIANLEDITDDFKKRSKFFEKSFKDYIQQRETYLGFLKSFNDDLEILEKIPIIPILLADGDAQNDSLRTSSEETTAHDQTASDDASKSGDPPDVVVTLFEWISASDSKSSMDQLHEHCARGLEQFDDRIFADLCDDTEKVFEEADNIKMKEIKGLGDRLFGLEQLMREAKRYVQEQSDLATSVTKNQSRITNLKDSSILPDLCASHRKQLAVMTQNHQQLCDIRRRCTKAKEELSVNLYHRLKWVMYVENKILVVMDKLVMYHANLRRLRQHLEILQQIHMAPATYLSMVAEIVRRRTFSQSFLLWASELACHLLTIHNDEVARRKEFQSWFDGHFLTALFPGMDDLPPSFATQAPSIFDSKLPKITQEDVDRLRKQLPDLAHNLNVPDVTWVTNFFLIKSVVKTEADKAAEEDKAEENMAQAVDEIAGMERNLMKERLPHLKDLDRGCESETDTEEFEKVGQSPLDLHFDKDLPSPRPGTQDASTSTGEGNLDVSRLECEKLKSLLIKMTNLAAQAVMQLKLELNDLKIQLFSEKNVIRQHFLTLDGSFLSLIAKREGEEKEIVQRMVVKHQSEISDFRKLAEVKNDEIKSLRAENAFLETKNRKINEGNIELKIRLDDVSAERSKTVEDLEKRLCDLETDKERSLKDVSDRLNREHKAEMENIRTRFKLMTMERSPSDTSLEKIDFNSLTNHESIFHQMSENFEIEKDKLIRETAESESRKWTKILEEKCAELRTEFERDRDLLLGEISDGISEEKDRRIEELLAYQKGLADRCDRYRDTIDKLVSGDERNAEMVEMLNVEGEKEPGEGEKEASEGETRGGRSDKVDMTASVNVCEGKIDASTSPVKQRKSLSRSQTLTKSTKLNIDSCKSGDCIVIVWDEEHENFKVLQETILLYFLHTDCTSRLGLIINDGPPRRPNKYYCLGEVVDKEYCHARKAENRYKVPMGTKFFRVRVKPWTERADSIRTSTDSGVPPMSQSQTVSSTRSDIGPSTSDYHSLPSSPNKTNFPEAIPEDDSCESKRRSSIDYEDNLCNIEESSKDNQSSDRSSSAYHCDNSKTCENVETSDSELVSREVSPPAALTVESNR